MSKLDHSKILVTCFSEPSTRVTLSNHEKPDNQILALLGFERNLDPKQKSVEICDNILNSILIHDKVVIEGVNLIELVQIFGLDNVILLIKNNCFEFLNTIGLKPFLVKEGNTYRPVFYRNVTSTNDIIDSLGVAEKNLFRDLSASDNQKLSLLFSIADNHKIQFNLKTIEQYEKIILDELDFDLKNTHLTLSQNIITSEKNLIHELDKYKILRILSLNKTLLLSQNNAINNIKLEGGIHNYLNYKLSPIINKSQFLSKSEDLFKKVLNHKKIPDVGELYRKGIITIPDILKIRNNIDGRVFRIWYNSTDYVEEEVYKELLRSYRTIKDKIIWKSLGWLVPTAVGISNPGLGAILSLSGNLYENLITKWRPSLFLDNRLENFINEKILTHDRAIRESQIKERFPKINRNDPCPCLSGKKFKNCCGKIF